MIPGGAVGMGAMGGGNHMMASSPQGPNNPLPQLPEWLPIPEAFASNPMFTAGFGLVGMGALMTGFRSATATFSAMAKKRFLTSLEIASKDYSYQWVMQYLVARHGKCMAGRHLGVETTHVKDSTGNTCTHFDFVPATGRHWMWYKNTPILLERNREVKSVEMTTGSPFETLTMTTMSIKANIFSEFLEEAKSLANQKESGKTIIYHGLGSEWRPFGLPKTIRPIESVILDQHLSEYLLDDVKEFLRSSDWYFNRGIPYRRGYLLFGPPGSGKSSYVMALAGALKYNICVLNLGDPTMTDDRLQHLLAVAPPRTIVLLEDVDWAVGNHANNNNNNNQSQDPIIAQRYSGLARVTFSGLLNALDGVVATEERLIFMTTNRIDLLPPVMIRPGRIDVQACIGSATKLQAQRMFSRFYPDATDSEAVEFAEIVIKNKVPVSMAELQGFFLFFKSDKDALMKNAPLFVQGVMAGGRQQHDLSGVNKENHDQNDIDLENNNSFEAREQAEKDERKKIFSAEY